MIFFLANQTGLPLPANVDSNIVCMVNSLEQAMNDNDLTIVIVVGFGGACFFLYVLVQLIRTATGAVQRSAAAKTRASLRR